MAVCTFVPSKDNYESLFQRKSYHPFLGTYLWVVVVKIHKYKNVYSIFTRIGFYNKPKLILFVVLLLGFIGSLLDHLVSWPSLHPSLANVRFLQLDTPLQVQNPFYNVFQFKSWF